MAMPSIRPSVCASVSPSVHLVVRPSIRPCRLSVRPSVRPSIRPCRLSVRPSLRPSICLFVRMFDRFINLLYIQQVFIMYLLCIYPSYLSIIY